MKAALYYAFGEPLVVETVSDPTPTADGVVVRVMANGVCRSDWHGWQGHFPEMSELLPHVPGHELAGVVEACGQDVRLWQPGDRIVVPFCGGCGYCEQCITGNQQICDNHFQPGFTAWGSFAEYVAINYADVNLARLPEELDFVSAASLGCRFITAFRGVTAQGRVTAGEWVVIHGCGGVGLSGVMIATALGAQVIAVDINEAALDLARELGAVHTLNGRTEADVVEAIHEITRGGAHVSVDALGSVTTCRNSILGLRKRGRHVQIGLMVGQDADPPLPMSEVIAKELELIGSHGMQASVYPRIFDMIRAGRFQPQKLINRTISLEESPAALAAMDKFSYTGATVIKF